MTIRRDIFPESSFTRIQTPLPPVRHSIITPHGREWYFERPPRAVVQGLWSR